MAYFNSRDLAAISLCAALWGVLNAIFSPIFFAITGMPFLCDLIGFFTLILTVWWIRKPGAATVVGLIATVISFSLNPGGIHFLAFTAASVVFDLLTWTIGYKKLFGKPIITAVSLTAISLLSATLAGFLIASFFMPSQTLALWTGLHAAGGVIGGIVGFLLIAALRSIKGLDPNSLVI